MPRVISFLVLLAIVLLVGMLFFQVMAQFIVPLFLAAVLVVVFQPLHKWVRRRLPRRQRVAALATTLLILLVVLLPLTWLGWNAYVECYAVYNDLQSDEAALSEEQEEGTNDLASQIDTRVKPVRDFYKRLTDRDLDTAALIQRAISWGGNFIGSALLTGVQAILSTVVGLVIMVIAVYYYLADGPAMTRALMRLSPLDDQYELELLDRFGDISRGVVVATLLSAVVQGAAAGVGYWFALPSEAPIFLLTAATMVLAIVPFVGSAGIWVFVCGWLFFFGPHTGANGQVEQGNWVAAVALGVYCAVIVSSADNVIKPLVLRGQANLHPLLALLSILGGVQVLGPVGILVGPMIVSFLQALLNMLNKELASFDKKDDDQPSTLAVATAQVADAVKTAALDQTPAEAPDATPAAADGPSDDQSADASAGKPDEQND